VVLLLFERDGVWRFDFALVIGISFGSAVHRRHRRSPTSAIKPAGQDPGTRLSSETSHSTALFAGECQPFLDNLIAGFGLT